MPNSPVRVSTRVLVIAAVLDVLFVLAFVLIGRASHHEDVVGTLITLWPFLVGLLAGWLVSRAWQRPLAIRWTGVAAWLMTVVVGMIFRRGSGQGTEVSFVIVSLIVLGVFLLGWRGVAALVVRRRSRPAD